MSDIKGKAANIDPNVQARAMEELTAETDNIYKTLNVIRIRARQLNEQTRVELYKKLETFAESTETIEEVMENKEQVEISKHYERMPNPAVLATDEFVSGGLVYKHRGVAEGENEDAEDDKS